VWKQSDLIEADICCKLERVHRFLKIKIFKISKLNFNVKISRFTVILIDHIQLLAVHQLKLFFFSWKIHFSGCDFDKIIKYCEILFSCFDFFRGILQGGTFEFESFGLFTSIFHICFPPVSLPNLKSDPKT
jgi:hypothetical protein